MFQASYSLFSAAARVFDPRASNAHTHSDTHILNSCDGASSYISISAYINASSAENTVCVAGIELCTYVFPFRNAPPRTQISAQILHDVRLFKSRIYYMCVGGWEDSMGGWRYPIKHVSLVTLRICKNDLVAWQLRSPVCIIKVQVLVLLHTSIYLNG